MSLLDVKFRSLENKLLLADSVSGKVHHRHVYLSDNVFTPEEYETVIKPQEKLMHLPAKMITENPYIQKTSLFEGKIGEWELTFSGREAYELLPGGGIDVKGLTFQKIVYYSESITFPFLRKGDVPWMSITPNEILTMDYELSRMKGDILVGGLGMGYFLLMAAEREQVNKITVAELDQDVIELMGFIKDFCKRPDRIEIIHADALDLLKSSHDKYDSFFMDVWDANPRETANVYIPFKDFGLTNKVRNIHYWNEIIMREALFYDLFNYLRGQYYNQSFLHSDIALIVREVLKHESIDLSVKGIDRLLKTKEATIDFYLQVLAKTVLK